MASSFLAKGLAGHSSSAGEGRLEKSDGAAEQRGAGTGVLRHTVGLGQLRVHSNSWDGMGSE